MLNARARVAYQGSFLVIEIVTSAFDTHIVRAVLNVDDIHPLTPKAADPSLFELLDLAVALYTIDRSVRIGAGQMRRSFELRLPVADVLAWRRNASLVSEWYEALTGDVVELVPVSRDINRATHHLRPSSFPFDDGVDVVGLLSDGLDSLCGADTAVRATPRLALASVITSPQRRASIGRVADGLRCKGRSSFQLYSLGTRLRRRHKGEQSQRSRTVLAFVTGLTVAHALGAGVVQCYENGFGLLNLPVPDLQYGSMSSQVLNPAHIPLWDRMTRAFFGETIEVRYPNQFLTKADMVRGLSDVARELVRCTFSCDRPLRLPGVSQCGTCGSCRYRQLSIASAGVPIDDALYAYRHVGNGPDAERVMRYHAGLLASALQKPDPWNALVMLQPELGPILRSEEGRAVTAGDHYGRRGEIRTGTVELLRRHVAEVERWEAVRAA